jgi:hypothetical protein
VDPYYCFNVDTRSVGENGRTVHDWLGLIATVNSMKYPSYGLTLSSQKITGRDFRSVTAPFRVNSSSPSRSICT